MTYERFEELPVWNTAISLGHGVFDLVEDRAFGALGDLRNQLQRAVLSISNNIAEGFERGTTAELLTFIYIARGSAAETRSASRFAAERRQLIQLRPSIQSKSAARSRCRGNCVPGQEVCRIRTSPASVD